MLIRMGIDKCRVEKSNQKPFPKLPKYIITKCSSQVYNVDSLNCCQSRDFLFSLYNVTRT